MPALRLNRPFVEFDADNPRARLQHLERRWTDVCAAPCGRNVSPVGLYRVGGGTVKGSTPFELPRAAGSVQVRANVGSVVKYWMGAAIALNGVAFMGMGGLLTAISGDSSNNLDPMARDSQHGMGVAYLVVGVICLVIGVPLWLGNNTTVEVR